MMDNELAVSEAVGEVEQPAQQLGDTQPLPRLSELTEEKREQTPAEQLGDTRPLPSVSDIAPEQPVEEVFDLLTQVENMIRGETAPAEPPKQEEPFSGNWEPEYEQPIGEYVPPQPIVFRPKSRLHELKRKLVAGPEKRYYEISEQGFGKLQAAIFLSFLVVVLSTVATAMYALDMIQPDRMKLMIFSQFLAMMVAALLGSYQLVEGVADLLRGRFSTDTMLVLTFIVCCVDGVFCLQEQRVPCCAAFSLQVMMSLWGAYNRRSTEMGQMDTMRKAVRLDSLVVEPDYFDGTDGVLRGEGQVEDFMDHYRTPSAMEKTLSVYSVVALLICLGLGLAAGMLHESVSFGIQVSAVSLLAATPVTMFIAISRPAAILERRLHTLGTVLCGWRGIKALSRRAVFPLSHNDLFPMGSCKLNGVKFYGNRNPDQIVAYATAVIDACGGGLVPLFTQLLDSRNGRHYSVENMRAYGNGGLGGEVCGEPVLVGVPEFLKDMGVEIPEGTRVNQAVYVAIDGELCGLFAVTYVRDKSALIGLQTLCAYRGLRPVLTTGDFMFTESFIRGKFGVNTRRIAFPERSVRRELAEKKPDGEAPALALITGKGLAPYAYAVTGSRALRSAWRVGVTVQLIGGIVGLAMMAVLAVLGARELLTPANVLLYELVWMIPGLLVTEWTRSV